MSEEREALGASMAKMESELAHANKHLERIDTSIDEMRKSIARQNNLQKDIDEVVRENAGMKHDMNGLGARVSKSEEMIGAVSRQMSDLPKTVKVNVFDYIWKYAALAVGGWISLKVAGVLP